MIDTKRLKKYSVTHVIKGLQLWMEIQSKKICRKYCINQKLKFETVTINRFDLYSGGFFTTIALKKYTS